MRRAIYVLVVMAIPSLTVGDTVKDRNNGEFNGIVTFSSGTLVLHFEYLITTEGVWQGAPKLASASRSLRVGQVKSIEFNDQTTDQPPPGNGLHGSLIDYAQDCKKREDDTLFFSNGSTKQGQLRKITKKAVELNVAKSKKGHQPFPKDDITQVRMGRCIVD